MGLPCGGTRPCGHFVRSSIFIYERQILQGIIVPAQYSEYCRFNKLFKICKITAVRGTFRLDLVSQQSIYRVGELAKNTSVWFSQQSSDSPNDSYLSPQYVHPLIFIGNQT